MQAHIVKQMPSLKVGYVNPQPIAQTNFDYPRKWKLDYKEISAGKTVAKKEAIRNGVIRKEFLRVAAYLVVSFTHLQQNDVICTIQLQVSSTLYLKLIQYIFVQCKTSYLFSSMIEFMQRPLDCYRRRCRKEHGMGLWFCRLWTTHIQRIHNDSQDVYISIILISLYAYIYTLTFSFAY
jgi:hypothetical protein